MLSEGKFEVRPPPGMSLPVRRIRLSGHRFSSHPPKHHLSAHGARPRIDPPSDASDAGIFPEPLAPSSPGTDPGTRSAGSIPTNPQPTSPPMPRPDVFVEPDTVPRQQGPLGPTYRTPFRSAHRVFSGLGSATTPIPPPPKDNYTSTGPTPTGYEELPTWNTESKAVNQNLMSKRQSIGQLRISVKLRSSHLRDFWNAFVIPSAGWSRNEFLQRMI